MNLATKVALEMSRKAGGCKSCKTHLLWNVSLLAYVCKCRSLSLTNQEIYEARDPSSLAGLLFDKIESSAEPEWAGFSNEKKNFLRTLRVTGCARCGGRFDIVHDDPVKFECVCGLMFFGDELFSLEATFQVPWLLKKIALLSDGHEVCNACEGKGGRCEGCRGTGAKEIYDCNGNCHECKGRGTRGFDNGACSYCRGVATITKWRENAQA